MDMDAMPINFGVWLRMRERRPRTISAQAQKNETNQEHQKL
jgi:hypothetical protein